MAIWAFAQKAAQDVAVRGRLALSAFMWPDGSLKARSGLVPDDGGLATVSVGTMNVNVTAFRAMVQGTFSGVQGMYPVVMDAAGSVTLPDGGGSPTTHTVAAIVEDSGFDLSGQLRARLISYPNASGPPSGTILKLREFIVPAGASAGTGGLAAGAASTDMRQWTVASGGILPVTGQTQRDAITNLRDSMLVYRDDTDQLELRAAGAWTNVLGNGSLQVFVSNGTWNKPAGLKYIRGFLVAGGGAGGAGITTGAAQGAAGGNGGGGQTCYFVIPAASLPSSVAVGIGAGGTAPAGDGVNSTFGTLVTANKGLGGVNQVSAFNSGTTAGGAGGSGTGGSWSPVMRFDGESGLQGKVGNAEPQSGRGGSPGMGFGSGGRQGVGTNTSAGETGGLYGGGGGGGLNRASITPGAVGGNGAPGLCIIENIL